MDSSNCFELWETNGTATGTFELIGVTGANAAGLYPLDLTPYHGNEVLFCGYDSNGISGLWETNGTAVGTRELIAGDGKPWGLFPSDLTPYDGDMLFSGSEASRTGRPLARMN
jgi:hypothetical protein